MLFGAIGVLAVGYAVFLLVTGMQDAGDKVSSIISASIGLCSLAVSATSLHLQLRTSPDLAATVEKLAKQIAAQWREELGVRGIDRPLVTRWSVVAAPGMAGEARVLRFKAQGDITDVEPNWRELKVPRLAVLGEPGSGKTSLVITLVEALARNHRVGEPVPVLLNPAAWWTDTLQEWMEAEISCQYRVRPATVRELFEKRWLLRSSTASTRTGPTGAPPSWWQSPGGSGRRTRVW